MKPLSVFAVLASFLFLAGCMDDDVSSQTETTPPAVNNADTETADTELGTPEETVTAAKPVAPEDGNKEAANEPKNDQPADPVEKGAAEEPSPSEN